MNNSALGERPQVILVGSFADKAKWYAVPGDPNLLSDLQGDEEDIRRPSTARPTAASSPGESQANMAFESKSGSLASLKVSKKTCLYVSHWGDCFAQAESEVFKDTLQVSSTFLPMDTGKRGKSFGVLLDVCPLS